MFCFTTFELYWWAVANKWLNAYYRPQKLSWTLNNIIKHEDSSTLCLYYCKLFYEYEEYLAIVKTFANLEDVGNFFQISKRFPNYVFPK